jgi:uncharacterized protein
MKEIYITFWRCIMSEQPVYSEEITSDDKLWALLGYLIPLVALIALLMEDKKNRKFIRVHAIQSLAINVVFWVINIILSFVFFIGCVTALATIGLMIYYGVKAYRGEYFDIPVVTDFCKKQNWI